MEIRFLVTPPNVLTVAYVNIKCETHSQTIRNFERHVEQALYTFFCKKDEKRVFMERIQLGDALDFVISFVILSINVVMLFIMLSSNISLGSVLVWERAINRGLLFGNIALAVLSFYWIYRKRIKFEYFLEEIKLKQKHSKQI
jgi:hypothetical protein